MQNGLPGPGAGENSPGLYIHIPFCHSKCPYCSFDSRSCDSTAVLARYLAALRLQAARMAATDWAVTQEFTTIFIGGGTPTLYEAGQLGELLARCAELFRFTAEMEVTVEANPNSLDGDKLRGLRRAGFNRLSIGMQSFDDRLLRGLGRTHSARDGMLAVEAARAAGFDNLSLDLMYGLPGQDLAAWRATLEIGLDLAPAHFSLYELTVEEGTPFGDRAAAGTLKLPAEETVAAMATLCRDMLDSRGYEQYEISNYARPGFRCGHNINYWQNGSYLGLGAGAVSCLSGLRLKNVVSPQRFMALLDAGCDPFAGGEGLDRESRFRETVIMGLRMLAGVSCQGLERRFGLSPARYYGGTLTRLISQGLLKLEGDRLRLTARGLELANPVLAELV